MAKLSSDGKYVTVEKGDTLSEIAEKHLGSWKKYQQLATWNNISNSNLIYVGQKIYLSKNGASSSGSSSSSKKSSSNSNKVTITHFGVQANSDNTLFVTWSWSKSNTDNYEVEWYYATGDGVWFVGTDTSTTAKQSTYSIPSNATKVRVRIKPISKTYTKNNKETKYWTANWSSYKTWTDSTPLATPSTPSVKLEKFKLTASLENIDISGAKQIQFQIYKNDGKSAYKTGKATITATKAASYSCTVVAGGEYKVRCRALNGSKDSEWSDFSSGVTCDIPNAPSGITEIRALSSTSVRLDWDGVSNVDSYEIEYTTQKRYFDSSNEVQTMTIDNSVTKTSHAEITGLTSGQEYFFRIRCKNDGSDDNISAWTAIKSIVLGKAPSAPTTWSSTTTAITGEDVILYWVHNSEDNSKERKAELELIISGLTSAGTTSGTNVGMSIETKVIENPSFDDEEAEERIASYTIDTSNYAEGVKIQWRVRTCGITNEYGEWSTQRTVDIYAPPELELSVTDSLATDANVVETLTSFPFYIYGLPGPNTQIPISYHVSIVANESYETVDNVGNVKIVSQGDEVYSEYYDISQSLLLELLPSSVDLENNITYTITCVVSMNSGLTAEATHEFSVSWTDEIYTPNAEIGYDPELYVTHIHPYCMEHQTNYYKVDYASSSYTKTSEKLDDATLDGLYTETGEKVYVGVLPGDLRIHYCIVDTNQNGESIDPIYYFVNNDSGTYIVSDTIVEEADISSAYTTTGEEVLIGSDEDGNSTYYCVIEGTTLIDNVTLSVYRREYDGRFVELATGLNNTSNTYVTDPHPALDYARYRIVAISNDTGAVSFYDVPGEPINEVAAIIQWDEEWSNFDTTETSELEQKPWTGSLIRLPYNIDISDSSAPDVASIEYIGRAHPVSYYGTQLGITSSWNMEIPKSDKETLYALRRLMIYMGDVYVREPSGSGYWASVKVSFSQTHCEVTIPVSLEVTRVEGGA